MSIELYMYPKCSSCNVSMRLCLICMPNSPRATGSSTAPIHLKCNKGHSQTFMLISYSMCKLQSILPSVHTPRQFWWYTVHASRWKIIHLGYSNINCSCQANTIADHAVCQINTFNPSLVGGALSFVLNKD